MKKNYLNKKIIYIVSSVLLIGVVFFIGFYLGKTTKTAIEKADTLINKENEILDKVNFNPFWDVWNILNEKYVGLEKNNDQEKVWGAIKGLTDSLEDPYTIFLPPSEAEMFNSDIQGNFGGVGMEIGIRNNILTVIAPLKDTPADKVGIQSGDKIIKIEGELTTDFSIEKAVKLIRGEVGTPVNLEISREGLDKLIEVTIIRDNIKIPTIKTELKEGVFVIELYNFSAISPNLFREALREFVKSGTNKLIIDLRGNPGGFLEAAVDMASWFLPEGKVIVVENSGENKKNDKIHRSRGYNIFNDNFKLVILVDGGSASASEIFAGALKEHGIATLVGSQTFGKGSVQELIEITSDTSLKVTVARWLTPNGNSISKNGLTPDIEVIFKKEDLEKGNDPQLDKAIELLNKKY